MREHGIFYHVVGDKWEEGQPLRCWDDLVADGILTEADWGRPERGKVGYDGDLVSLFANLIDARAMSLAGNRILRVRIHDEFLHNIKSNAEDYYCYPREIPPEWLDVVDDDE